MSDWPVDPEAFRSWCDSVGGFPQSTTNNYTGRGEEVCTFDDISESEGARVKTYMDDRGFVFARDSDDESMHKMHDVEFMHLSEDGTMEVAVRTDGGNTNEHEFDFSTD